MNAIEAKIGKEAREFLKQDGKIAILGTIDDKGCPHLDFITFLQGVGTEQIKLCRFCEPGEKQFFEKRPEAAFLVLSPQMRWLRGSMHYTHHEESGEVFDAHRGNLLLGFNRLYFFDLVTIDEIRKMQMQKIFIGLAMSRVKAKFVSTGARKALTEKCRLLFSDTGAFKFLCWKEGSHLSDIVPVVQAIPLSADRIVFSPMPHGEDFADADIGAKAAILCVNGKLQNTLAKGTLVSKGVLEIEKVVEGEMNEYCTS